MNSLDIIRLLLLAAIWGGSFLLMRIASPVLGAAYPGKAYNGTIRRAMSARAAAASK